MGSPQRLSPTEVGCGGQTADGTRDSPIERRKKFEKVSAARRAQPNDADRRDVNKVHKMHNDFRQLPVVNPWCKCISVDPSQ